VPVLRCEIDGKPGFKWGQQGKCYTYTSGDTSGSKRARQKAILQGIAIGDYEEDPVEAREQVDKPTAAQRRDLPAPAFAAIFYDGDEFLRSKSKLPHHINTVRDPNANGTVDVPRLRNALARFNQTDFSGFPSGTKEKARAHLERHADAVLRGREDADLAAALAALRGE